MVGPLPQYWHFASTWEDSVYLGRPRLPGADRVYTLQTLYPCARVNGVSGPFFWPPSARFPNIGTSRLQHADNVYN